MRMKTMIDDNISLSNVTLFSQQHCQLVKYKVWETVCISFVHERKIIVAKPELFVFQQIKPF